MSKTRTELWDDHLDLFRKITVSELDLQAFWKIVDRLWSNFNSKPKDRGCARELRNVFTALLAMMHSRGQNATLVLKSYNLVADRIGEALGYHSFHQKSLAYIPPEEKDDVLRTAQRLSESIIFQRESTSPSTDNEAAADFSVFGLPSSSSLSSEKPDVEYAFLTACEAFQSR